MPTSLRRTAVSLGVALGVVTAAGCSDPAGPASERDPTTSQQTRLLRGLDREFVQLAREIPGFGGLSRSADGSAVLFLTDPSRATAARQAVAARSRRLRGIDVSRIQVRTAKFDYIRLTDWRARLRDGLDVKGLVFLDIDESSNALRVGVEKGTSHDLVMSEVTRMDVPGDAVTVEDAEPLRFTSTLRDRVRPTLGGLQIAYNSAELPPGFYYICTLSFNARQATSSDTYLVTNSHCSGEMGGVQHAEIFQPTPLPENLVALEHRDPDYFVEDCYPHRRCRFSDASLSRYMPGVQATIGSIARTTLRGLTAGSLIINDATPSFTIVDRQPFAVMGQTLDKMGRTTGWTVGTVAATCADFFVADKDIALLCQDAMFSGVEGGDSGAPVFESQAPFTNDVVLYGIVSLGGTSSFGPYVVFSPMENIEFELGPLMVTAP